MALATRVNTDDDIDLHIDRGDLDAILRSIEIICDRQDWVELARVNNRCRRAHERGHQLWPAAMYGEYRLVLGGTPELAAQVVVESPGVFAVGPLAEVAAHAHLWDDIEPHLPNGAARNQVAAEAVVRGDVIASDAAELELPGALQGWEPDYDLAEYKADSIDAPSTPLPALRPVDPVAPGRLRTDDAAEQGLRDLVTPWLSSSEGNCVTVSVVGSAQQAIAALHRGPISATELEPAQALRLMAWTAASGGAQGRRRGAAAGRAIAWHAVAALAGDPAWPPHPDDIGEWLEELRWWAWDAHGEHRGWRLRLAVEDPQHGVSWAIDAHDHERAAPQGDPSMDL